MISRRRWVMKSIKEKIRGIMRRLWIIEEKKDGEFLAEDVPSFGFMWIIQFITRNEKSEKNQERR